MKPLLRILAAVAGLALCGCGHLELAPEGALPRVLTGTVDLGDGAALPPDAVVTVRVVEPPRIGQAQHVYGSQTIRNPGSSPVAFRIEYQAEDDVLNRGLIIEARVSWGGRMRYYNMNGYAFNLRNATEPHRIAVNAVGQ